MSSVKCVIPKGRTIWYMRGGLEKNWKKKFLATKVRKKSLLKMGAEKVPYIIGKAYDKKFLRRNIKKIVGRWSPKKKIVLSRRWKKKFASNKNSSPPPQIYNGASLNQSMLATRHQANTINVPIVCMMLGQRSRRCANIKHTLGSTNVCWFRYKTVTQITIMDTPNGIRTTELSHLIIAII